MKQTDDLFDLVKSLKKTEKRYFKLYATRHSEEANSVKLFSAIEKMDEYDDVLLRKIFNGEKFLEQLAVAKHYLSKIILESMTLYHSESSKNLEVSHLLQQVEFLMSKGLVEQAAKKNAKAMLIATRVENFPKLLDCFTWERLILNKQNYKAIPNLFEKESEVLRKLNNILEYRQLSAKVFSILKQAGRIPNELQWNEINSTLDNPLLKNVSNAYTFESKGHYFNIHAAVSFVKGDNSMTYRYTKEHVEWLEQNPLQTKLRPKSYLDSLHNYLHSCLDMNNFDELEIGLQKLKLLPNEIPYMQEPAFITFHSLDLLLRLNSGDYKKGIESVRQIEEGLEKFVNIPKTEKAILYDRVIRLYLADNQPIIALKWVNNILNDSGIREVRNDIVTSIKVLNILIHLELKNYDYAHYLVKSDSRVFRKNNMSSVEYIIVKNIGALPLKNKKIVPPDIKFYHKILLELQQNNESESIPNNKNLGVSTFLPTWFKNKVNQVLS
ncbi:MAG: hypothetical protein JST20_06500 [Bacteroidetes bacterium]|nr:hypothetical protein [Bacteroidota bacterium]